MQETLALILQEIKEIKAKVGNLEQQVTALDEKFDKRIN